MEEEGGRRGNRDRGTAQKSQDLTVSELFQTVSDSILLSSAIRKEALIVIALAETSGAQLIFTQTSPAHIVCYSHAMALEKKTN